MIHEANLERVLSRSSSSRWAVMVTSDARIATNKASIMTVNNHQKHTQTLFTSPHFTYVRSLNCISSVTTAHDLKRSTSCTPTSLAPHTTATLILPDFFQNGSGSEPWRGDDGIVGVEATSPIPYPREERQFRCQVRSQLPLRKGQVPAQPERASRQQAMPLHDMPDSAR